MDVAEVAAWTGADPADPLLPRVLATAQVMVAEFLGVDGTHSCPDLVQDQAVLQLSSELLTRRNSPAGGAVWGPDGSVVRLSRDVMLSVAPMLEAYGPGPYQVG